MCNIVESRVSKCSLRFGSRVAANTAQDQAGDDGQSQRRDWQEAHEAAEALRICGLHRQASGRVLDLAGRYMGRITYHTRRTALMPTMYLYCSRHQCYKTAAPSRNPAEHGAMRWLAAQRQYESRAAHEAAFAEMVLLSQWASEQKYATSPA